MAAALYYYFSRIALLFVACNATLTLNITVKTNCKKSKQGTVAFIFIQLQNYLTTHRMLVMLI